MYGQVKIWDHIRICKWTKVNNLISYMGHKVIQILVWDVEGGKQSDRLDIIARMMKWTEMYAVNNNIT